MGWASWDGQGWPLAWLRADGVGGVSISLCESVTFCCRLLSVHVCCQSTLPCPPTTWNSTNNMCRCHGSDEARVHLAARPPTRRDPRDAACVCRASYSLQLPRAEPPAPSAQCPPPPDYVYRPLLSRPALGVASG